MKATVVQLDTESHRAVQALLPWYVTQRLEGAELARVEAHLAACPHCLADFEWERTVQAAHGGLHTSGDVERGLARLRSRIDTRRRRRLPRLISGVVDGWHDSPPVWRWTLGAQFLAIVSLSAAIVLAPVLAPRYRTLGVSSDATAGRLVVVFRPDATEQEIRQALIGSGTRLVDGPTVTVSEDQLPAVPERVVVVALVVHRRQHGGACVVVGVAAVDHRVHLQGGGHAVGRLVDGDVAGRLVTR